MGVQYKGEGKRLQALVKEIVTKPYFVDPTEEKAGHIKVPYFKVALGVFTYAGRKNAVLQGRSGTGKTTYSGVVSARLSGLPYDLYDALKIIGHPDQTKATMIARPDIAKLNMGKDATEEAIWQPSLYLPSLTVDELNRLSPGKQSVLLEYIRTGVVEELGHVFSNRKPAFFATLNYNGAGTYQIVPPLVDRFNISIEFLSGASTLQDHIQAARRNIERMKDPVTAKTQLRYLLDKNQSPEEKSNHVNKAMVEHDDIAGIIEIADDLEFDADGKTFLRCIFDETNATRLYGENRREDPTDASSHNTSFASANVLEGLSPRFWESAEFYSRMLAAYLEADAVGIDHVQAVAPYCMAHRLDFTEDFKAKYKDQPRLGGENEQFDLTRRLLAGIKTNYDAVANELKSLDMFLSGKADKKMDVLETAKNVARGPEPDHPLLRIYWQEAKRKLGS